MALGFPLDKRRRRVTAVLILSIASVGCRASPPKDSADGGSITRFGSVRDASLPSVGPLECGDARCLDPENGGPLGELGCCLPSSACGIRARLLSAPCLAPHQPGNVDLACPSDELADGTTIQGCCTPSGRCGLYDRFGDLGCVPAELGDGATCRPVPDASCRSIVEVPCDGPEDCAPGTVCCGRTSHGAFDAFGCFGSCNVESADHGQLWFEICHKGGSCQDTRATCSSVPGLESSLGRCRANPIPIDGAVPLDGGTFAKGVGCGRTVCGAAEKCCEREPLEPYCSPVGIPCECAPDFGG